MEKRKPNFYSLLLKFDLFYFSAGIYGRASGLAVRNNYSCITPYLKANNKYHHHHESIYHILLFETSHRFLHKININ